MKKLLLIVSLLPAIAFAQKSSKTKAHKKPVAVVKKAADEYIISGKTTGYPDGTKVSLLNGITARPESETTIKKNKFTLKGKIPSPDFKLLSFNNKQPYVTIFTDNSSIKVVAKKDSLDQALVTGSKSHNEYLNYLNSLQPYQQAFNENEAYDSLIEKKAIELTAGYATRHPKSFLAPLTIVHYNQIGAKNDQTQKLYDQLDSNVKISSMGNYVVQLIEDAKRKGIGTVMEDFSQADTAGNAVALSSLRGKYVLVDFWASWCRPCRMENPTVVAAYNQFQHKNFTVLGVSLDKGKQAWVDAIQQDGLNWTNISDLQGWQNAAALKFQVYSIPHNILIDAEGKIVGRNLRGPALFKKLNQILN